MSDVQAHLDASTAAWEAGLAEMKFFHTTSFCANWREAELHRERAIAHFEASLDAMTRASRALAKMRETPNQ